MLISEDVLICEGYISKMFWSFGDAYLPSLHLSTVELCCKLQEKLYRVTWPIPKVAMLFHCKGMTSTVTKIEICL